MMSARLRINNYHTPKARLVGPKAAHVPPAWKNSNIPAAAQAQVNGHANRAAFGSLPGAGRILLSNLPVDVMLDEVVDLLKKTVGPTKEAIMCHDEKGRPLGIAVIGFVNPIHAAVARTKFHRKVIDGRRELRIELVYDSDPPKPAPPPIGPRSIVTPAPPRPKTLLDRIGGSTTPNGSANNNPVAGPSRINAISQTQQLRPSTKFTPPAFRQVRHQPTVPVSAPISGAHQRLGRLKKGPRRVRKFVTVADLDKEMDEYNATRDMDATG